MASRWRRRRSLHQRRLRLRGPKDDFSASWIWTRTENKKNHTFHRNETIPACFVVPVSSPWPLNASFLTSSPACFPTHPPLPLVSSSAMKKNVYEAKSSKLSCFKFAQGGNRGIFSQLALAGPREKRLLPLQRRRRLPLPLPPVLCPHLFLLHYTIA